MLQKVTARAGEIINSESPTWQIQLFSAGELSVNSLQFSPFIHSLFTIISRIIPSNCFWSAACLQGARGRCLLLASQALIIRFWWDEQVMWPHAVSPKAAAQLLPSPLMNSQQLWADIPCFSCTSLLSASSLVSKSFVRRFLREQWLQHGFRARLIWVFPELVLTGPIGHMSSRIFKISKS